MALIICYECSNAISDKAKNCPHCGAPKIAEEDKIQKEKIQEKIDSAQKEYEENQKNISNITSRFSDIVLKSAVSTFFFILILFLKMVVIFGISVGITGSVGPNPYMGIGICIALITTFIIVRKIYFSKFIKKLSEKAFIKNHFALTGILISFLFWFIIIHLSPISAFNSVKEVSAEMARIWSEATIVMEGFFRFFYYFYHFISENIELFAIALVLSIIGKFGFKQNFNHLFGIQIFIFIVINLIYIHLKQ